MPDIRGKRIALVLACLFLSTATLGCEDEPQVFSGDESAVYGGMQFEVHDYQIHYLELMDDQGQTIEYPDPVLAVGITMTNVGEEAVEYDPTHDSRDLAESRTPLLYPGPDTAEIDWENFSPRHLGGVQLQEGVWEQQQQERTSLAPGDSLSDYYLFELPDEGEDELMLSVPPSMHHGELPVFIRFDYTEPEPQGPPVHSVGDRIEFDGVSFTVTSVSQEYIELEDSSEGEGFSNEPVLKIAYTIENDSDETITYDAAHRDVSGNEGAVVQSLHTSFTRIRFPANATPVGQGHRIDIEPGESIESFTTFERPGDPADTATFVLPAKHFDQSGRVRVAFSYEPEDVDEPEELQVD